MSGELDMQSFNLGMSQIGVNVAQELGKGADEVYKKLREEETHDTIEKSDKQPKAEDLAGMINPAVPLLAPPHSGTVDLAASGPGPGNTSAVGSTVPSGQSFTHQPLGSLEGTMRGVLDSWQTSVAQFVQASKHHDADEKKVAQNEDKIRWVQDVLQQGAAQNPHTALASAIIMAGLFGVMGAQKLDPTDAQSVGVNAIQNSIMASLPMVPSDMRAEFGLLGALMMSPAIYQAAALSIGKSDKTESQNLTQDFAKNYGDRVCKLVNEKEFTAILETIIQARAPGTEPLSKEQLQQYMAGFKLGMLMSAYALAYKAETGGMTGKEVLGDVQNMDLSKAGSKANLLDAIRQQLAALPASQRAEVLAQIEDWLDSKPKVESLMDPLKVFQGMMASSDDVQQKQAIRTRI